MLVAHVDMDCFFCACEIKRDPSLNGKPVIVGAVGDRGVVSAANYEARKYGVFSATPISKARRLCPEGIFLKGDFSLYSKESQAVMQVLSKFSEEVLQVSVDEAYLKIPDEAIVPLIQEEVLRRTGLSCSIGVAHTKMVAKIATDFKKPHGITIVHDIPTFLTPLPIEKIPGIGKVSKVHYQKRGVNTIGDLIVMDRFKVLDYFGMYGVRLQQIAKGEYVQRFQQYGPAKSVSRERTFYQDLADITLLQKTLAELCLEVYEDLGSSEYRTVSLKLRYADFTTLTREISLHGPTNSLAIISQCITELFEKNYNKDKKVRLLGVKLSNLLHENTRQTTLNVFSTCS